MSEFDVKKITNRAGTGAPNFTYGLNIAGSDSGLIGKAYTSSGTEPSSPANGDLWYDSTNDKLYYYVAGEFKQITHVNPITAWYGARGLFAGGGYPNSNVIDYITIASSGNAADFGDLSVARDPAVAGASNGTRAIFAGGRRDSSPFDSDVIDYVTTATLGNATDFGDLSEGLGYHHAVSNGVLGVILGGDAAPTLSKTVQYVTIETTGNATQFGSTVTQGTVEGSGCSDGTYSVHHAGKYYNESNVLQGFSNILYYMTIGTSGDTTDFGDLTYTDAYGQYNSAATSDTTRGLFCGGNRTTGANSIHYVTIQTTGNSTDFGDLTQNTRDHAAVSDATYAVFGGNSTGTSNVMSSVTIQTTGNASDFGDLTSGRYDLAAASGSAS